MADENEAYNLALLYDNLDNTDDDMISKPVSPNAVDVRPPLPPRGERRPPPPIPPPPVRHEHPDVERRGLGADCGGCGLGAAGRGRGGRGA
uniref:Uncharacterized protein n=1 Tax=Amphimedon queenslandica TaxID=400682 RepID=A0A1X7TU84_AMPQE